jgi:hypothetical protein
MANRKASRIAFLYAVVTALVATCIILFSMMVELSRWQSLVLLLGVLVVVWAIIFSFLEVGRIASGAKRIRGPDEAVDPDAPRHLIVEPPTGHPYPHHEDHEGSAGFDQGQYTSRLRDELPSIRSLWHRAHSKKPASESASRP